VTDQVKSNRKWIVTGLNRTKPCLLLEKIAVEIEKVKNEKAMRMRSPTHLSLQQLLKSHASVVEMCSKCCSKIDS
jgi:hypothetical protein